MRLTNVRDLGLALRSARKARGLNQQELAEQVGVSRQWVATLELGRSNPSMRQVLDALDALGLSIHVYDNDSRPPGSDSGIPGGLSLDDVLIALDADTR